LKKAFIGSFQSTTMLLSLSGEILYAGSDWTADGVTGKSFSESFPHLKYLFTEAKELSEGSIDRSENGFLYERDGYEILLTEKVVCLVKPNSSSLFPADLSETYRDLFENSLVGVFKTHVSGEIFHANKAYAQIFGFDSFADLRKFKSVDFYPDPSIRSAYLEELRQKRSLRNYLVKNINKHGKEIYLLTNVRLVEDNGEEYLEGALIDVTAQVEAEHKINVQNAELRKLEIILDNISDSVQVVNAKGEMVYLNNEAKKKLGIDHFVSGSLSVLKFSTYLNTKEKFDEHIKSLPLGISIVVETHHRNTKSGELFPVELNIRKELLQGEEHIISVGRDISQRLADKKTIDRQLRRIQDLNSAINSSSLVSVTDKKGTIVEVNDTFCEVSQYSRTELIGANHSLVSSRTHTTDFWKDFYSTILTGEIWTGDVCNRKKSGDLYWVRTVVYPVKNESGEIENFMSIRQEITKEKEQQQTIIKHLNFQDLLVNIALKLITVDSTSYHDQINQSLNEIGTFVRADRVYIFDYDHISQTCSNTFEWCNAGIDPQIEYLQDLPLSEFTEWTDRHFKGEIMDIPDVNSMPEIPMKELLVSQDIKSLLALPLMHNNVCVGFVGLDSVKTTQPFSENDKKILQLFAVMMVNLKNKVDTIRQIELANDQIALVNRDLEKRIQLEMDKTSHLTQSMANLDKLALIGELTSGLAHDLNTPLGAIKIGAESVRYTLENLFKNTLDKNSNENVQFACQRASEKSINMFVGGLQTLRESEAMSKFLKEHYGELPNHAETVEMFVKSRIIAEDPDTIDRVMHTNDPLAFLELIYHVMAIRTFVDTIMEASEKANAVVKSLRFYMKEGHETKNSHINLKQNLMTVVNVFSHMIRDNEIDFELLVDDNIELIGNGDRLYQLWANLIKNAIEATGMNGNIMITAQKFEQGVNVSVSNTGEPISPELQAKIWDKFFTTKSKNGTGLGLSIVKRIIDEHGARIALQSEADLTTFQITFLN